MTSCVYRRAVNKLHLTYSLFDKEQFVVWPRDQLALFPAVAVKCIPVVVLKVSGS